MKIIDRYVLKTQLTAVLLVLFVLVGLAAFIGFLAEAEKAGTGDYTMVNAFSYVLMTLPQIAIDMFPAATLIGSLLGLGSLASRSELVAMRAAGVSISRLAGSVAIVGVLLMLGAGVIGEWIAPQAEAYAKHQRSSKLNHQISVAGERGVWFKDGNSIVNITQWRDPTAVGQINQFIFSEDNALISIKRAQKGSYINQDWTLSDVVETDFNAQEIKTAAEQQSAWQVSLEPQTLQLFSVEPDHLSSKNLYDYTRFLRKNGLETQRYEVAFWSRIATSFSIVLMSLLALPFVFGSLRTGNNGVRLFFGVIIGITYMSANQMLVGTGEVYGLNAFLSAWLPTLVLAAITFSAILRTR